MPMNDSVGDPNIVYMSLLVTVHFNSKYTSHALYTANHVQENYVIPEQKNAKQNDQVHMAW